MKSKKKKKKEYTVKKKPMKDLRQSLKGETVISIQVWGLLSFRNTLREGSVIYPKKYYKNS